MTANIHALMEDTDENDRLSGFTIHEVVGSVSQAQIGFGELRNFSAASFTFADCPQADLYPERIGYCLFQPPSLFRLIEDPIDIPRCMG
ncbi:hypothetical protein ASE36_16345 [Rhizobium sp. Root274]|nr:MULTISPECIES: hypothetical protein [unclassified Rhizobium]KQW28023.1 hypothetical protein ASC71_16380 [Rhizobium sp. Root1240]KRD28307.1 hypothetical protein ASE36_16345 [Rhizobium sp. Root274]